MNDRQLIADLLSALEYHTEQTRPIEFSRVAIEAAREYLRKPAQQHPDLSHLRPETQEAIRGWIKDGTFFDRAIGTMHDQEKRLMAYEKAQQQEPVTVLPDGSAFAVMSYPLPKDHWLYADRQYNEGEYEPVELGKPVLTHELRNAVVSAVRYAIRGATNCGKEVDFDPDALVQNAVYALCGPFTSPPASKPWADECRIELVNAIHFLASDFENALGAFGGDAEARRKAEGDIAHARRVASRWNWNGTTPPPASKPWVGLTDEEVDECYYWKNRQWTTDELVRHVEAKLREKNA